MYKANNRFATQQTPRWHRLLLIGLPLILSACGPAPSFKEFAEPLPNQWQPVGDRYVGSTHPVLPDTLAFRTIHADTGNSDAVSLAYAPRFEQGWIAETHFFIPEGPSFDDAGNLYFSPIYPHEDVRLVSLDSQTGARRWAITGAGPGVGGAPLILNDPEQGGQVVYSGDYESIIAVSTDGTRLWETTTGLQLASSGQQSVHHFGINYHPQTDSLIAAMSDGHLVVLDRTSGTSRLLPFSLPGSRAIDNATQSQMPDLIAKKLDAMLAPFLNFDAGTGFSDFINALLGGGNEIANYFSIDAHTGTIWVAATAPDEADGTQDGFSELGALYGLSLEVDANGQGRIETRCSRFIEGGSASTPALRADGQRIYFGDAKGNLLAVGPDCELLWQAEIGSQIVGSIGVSADNHELYAATAETLVQIIDEGDRGVIRWQADLEAAFEPLGLGLHAMNLNLAGIGANGVMVHVGAGYRIQGIGMPLIMGVALLDRSNGAIRYAAQGAEETVSVMSSGPDGALYLAHSPVRHAIIKTLLPKQTSEMIGGIGKYQPIALHYLAHDASCAAADRLANRLNTTLSTPEMIQADLRQVQALITQALTAGQAALSAGTLPASVWTSWQQALLTAQGEVTAKPSSAMVSLEQACTQGSDFVFML
jgi:hypothetical protein